MRQVCVLVILVFNPFLVIIVIFSEVSLAYPTPLPGSDIIFPDYESPRRIHQRNVTRPFQRHRPATSTSKPEVSATRSRPRIPLTGKNAGDLSPVDRLSQSPHQTQQEPSKFTPKINDSGLPPCVKSSNYSFCEQVDDYPDQEIRQLVRYSPEEFHDIFGSLPVNGRRTYDDDELSEERICKFRTNVIYPKVAQNEVEEWVYVVNDIDYTQTVRVETCEEEGRPCTYLDTNLPPGFKSICRQKFAMRRLLAVHPKEKKTYTDSFPVPSCCVCYVKYPPIFASRSSRSRKTTR